MRVLPVILMLSSFMIASEVTQTYSIAESANDNTHTITTRSVDADGVPVITTAGSENDNANAPNAPASLNLGPASQQYVQKQQEQRTSGRMSETFGFGIGLIGLLAVVLIAYAIHPGKKEDHLHPLA